MSDPLRRDERPREECGVVAVASKGSDAATTAFYGIYALQHRGQEAAGIVTHDGVAAHIHKDVGLVSRVFGEKEIASLPGGMAIGHTRYSTTGASSARNAQPFLIETRYGQAALAHNGNLVNAPELRKKLLERGVGLSSASDTELMVMTLASAEGSDWPERIVNAMKSWTGAFSFVTVVGGRVFAARDPWGFRPLSCGTLPDGGTAAASETCALRTIGCEATTEVEPGAVVELTPSGVVRHPGLPPAKRLASCVFEFIYFARPDSVWNGISVHEARRRFGAMLAEEAPVEADIVIPVPDSSISAAIGYAAKAGLPYDEGFVKNRYIGRTFIQPTQALRKQGVALKFNALPHTVKGKRLVVVDDSIVRGTTAGPLIALLRKAGAKEVHLRVSSPPIKHPCYMGVDMGEPDDLIAHRLSVEEIRASIGADSLAYLSLAGLARSMGSDSGYCEACFTGDYPVDIAPGSSKHGFEAGGKRS